MKRMNTNLLIPRLRQDIAVDVVEENSNKLVVFSDPDGYADQPVAIPIELYPLLQIF